MKDWKRLAGKRRKDDIRETVVVDVTEIRAHGRHFRSGIGQCHSRLERHVLKSAIAEVVEEEVRHLVVCHKEVGKAIPVVIRDGDCHSLSLVFRDTGLLRYICKASVAQIAIEPVFRPFEHARVAVDADAARGIATKGVELGSPPYVVHYEEVEKTIVIEIEPGCSD